MVIFHSHVSLPEGIPRSPTGYLMIFNGELFVIPISGSMATAAADAFPGREPADKANKA
jgi:hypothetical protein